MLNMMFGLFDVMSEKNGVYKVFCNSLSLDQILVNYKYVNNTTIRWRLSRIASLV